jgi:ArsR family transcriptional regulator, arsenate/arsenite/antimonite-responsive transcriptional repressor
MSDATADRNDLSLPLIDVHEVMLQQVVLMAKALSDPIRVRMLGLMAVGRGCCGLPPVSDMPVPGQDEAEGICVCEFQERYSLGQSKVSYHLRVLKEAGLVTEECRGKWTFYSLNKQTAREIVRLIQGQMQL